MGMEATPGAARDSLKAVLVGGLIAGAIDISYAILVNIDRVAPSRIFQSVATGLLGRASYEGGAATAWLGALLHFGMAVAMAAIFVAAARRLPLVRRHLLLAGLVYGALIYFGMRFVVVPLSRFPGNMRVDIGLELAVHMVGVGLVIALAARRFAHLETPQAPRPAAGPAVQGE